MGGEISFSLRRATESVIEWVVLGAGPRCTPCKRQSFNFKPRSHSAAADHCSAVENVLFIGREASLHNSQACRLPVRCSVGRRITACGLGCVRKFYAATSI